MALLAARSVSVDFPIYHDGSRSLKKSLLALASGGNIGRDVKNRLAVRALNDVSFELNAGQRLGIMGHNGSGKTTLLKVLAGVYEPTHGMIVREGQLASLLDPTAGLNPDISGRENIVLIGMFLGQSAAAMRLSIDDIAAFSQLGAFLDMPVRTYSAGMRVRLGFAIATSLRPDILVMDEWLGAGDARFIDAAQKRITGMVESTSILVLASHSPQLLRQWCNLGLWLHEGKVAHLSDIDSTIKAYEESLGRPAITPTPSPAAV